MALERFVLTYEISDSCVFSCEVNDCVEYSSKEQLAFDLELFTEEHHMSREVPMFCGLELNPDRFFYRDSIKNYHYSPPEIQTLDEWFESKRGKQ